jgi:hypothetical protein
MKPENVSTAPANANAPAFMASDILHEIGDKTNAIVGALVPSIRALIRARL